MKNKKRLGVVVTSLALVLSMAFSFAYFTDRAEVEVNVYAGTVGIDETASEVWQSQLEDNAGTNTKNLNPGDSRSLKFTISNTDTKAIDVRHTIKLTVEDAYGNPKALDMTGIDPQIVGTEVNGKRVKVDLDRQVLKPLCGSGMMFCYDSPEYVRDMGTPDRYAAVCRDFAQGRVQAKNLKNKQKAIFLDRDGTINRYVGFLRNIDDFELLPDVAKAIQKINSLGYLAIVVTNQPVIARGEVTVDQLEEIHNKMQTLLGYESAYLDGIYYCPHHPHKGYAGEIPELKIDCDCRKPKPGLLLKAAKDFNIDLSQSYMVGDSENDILAGEAAGCKTALIAAEAFASVLQFVDKELLPQEGGN